MPVVFAVKTFTVAFATITEAGVMRTLDVEFVTDTAPEVMMVLAPPPVPVTSERVAVPVFDCMRITGEPVIDELPE